MPLRARGLRVGFGATGQTGILIDGRGIAVDAVIADFIAGAAERVTLDAAEDADIVLVEGQGSLIHPAYSGVTHGPHARRASARDGVVFAAIPCRHTGNQWVPVPPLADMVPLYETAMQHLRPSPVIAIAMNTFDLSDGDARASIDAAASATGLPVTDPVRYGPAVIADAIAAFHRRQR